MANITVEELKRVPVAQQAIEIVERKGLGHPDYMCDSIMEAVSVELSREYLKKFGVILHHNIDKGLLAAGAAERRFGGGIIKTPMRLIFGDRATFRFRDVEIPVADIAVRTAKQWFRQNLRFVDPDKHVDYQVEIRPGSEELSDIFSRSKGILGANDTSAVVGYYPLSPTEQLVLQTERYLNSKDFKKRFPASGEDVKVMGFRKNADLCLTVAMPLVDRFVEDEADYFKQKKQLLSVLQDFVKEKTSLKTTVDFNTLDQLGRGLNGIYLTVLGTSAEDADSGQVGRGGRANGLIPLNRPVSSEAIAGKNPVSHIGKIYNLLAQRIAQQVYENVDGADEVYIWLLSQIGKPISEPKIAAAQIVPKEQTLTHDQMKTVQSIISDQLARIGKFCEELARGGFAVS